MLDLSGSSTLFVPPEEHALAARCHETDFIGLQGRFQLDLPSNKKQFTSEKHEKLCSHQFFKNTSEENKTSKHFPTKTPQKGKPQTTPLVEFVFVVGRIGSLSVLSLHRKGGCLSRWTGGDANGTRGWDSTLDAWACGKCHGNYGRGFGRNPPKLPMPRVFPLRKKALIAGPIKGQAGDVSSFFLGGWVYQ